jgi:Carboxypeptidase regulatory-like domain
VELIGKAASLDNATRGLCSRILRRQALRNARACCIAALLGFAVAARAQQPTEGTAPDSNPSGSIHGVVVDRDGAVYEGAHISLAPTSSASPTPAMETTSAGNGRFNFADVPPGDFNLTISSNGFATQVVTGTLHPGESLEAKAIVLMMTAATSEVQVTASREEVAQAELKQEEKQRVFGVIPNFYVVYAPNAAPLSPKQKFSLAMRSFIDPVTFLGVGISAGFEQAGNGLSGYGQGARGYAKRYGAGYADGIINTTIGAGILASWWKQDPRYFQKGTGTIRSRAFYAIAMAVMCKGDNGRWQLNYSGIVGGLAAGGISNLYYPASDRAGWGLTFQNAAIGTGEGAIQNLIQEFLIRRLTPHVPNYGAAKQ